MTPDKYIAARKDSELAVLEGFHAIKHAIRFNVEFIDVCASNKNEIIQLCKDLAPDITARLEKNIREVSLNNFQSSTPYDLKSPILAAAKRKYWKEEDIFSKETTVVWLDNPKNHENIGAVVRLAAGLGEAGVVVTGDIDVWNPGVVRGSAGLMYAIPVIKTDKKPSDFYRKVVVFDENGQSIDDSKISGHAILVFGSERSGVSEQIKEQADQIVRIPMAENVSSLNLATSVAIGLWSTRTL